MIAATGAEKFSISAHTRVRMGNGVLLCIGR